jgi:hypothetical protein
MATIKGVYDLIKADKDAGKPINPIEQAILDAVEKEKEQPTTKEVDVSFVKNKDETN